MNALLCFARKGEKNHKHGVRFSDRNQPNILGDVVITVMAVGSYGASAICSVLI